VILEFEMREKSKFGGGSGQEIKAIVMCRTSWEGKDVSVCRTSWEGWQAEIRTPRNIDPERAPAEIHYHLRELLVRGPSNNTD